MKVNITVEQFKILEFLKENFDMEHIDIKLKERNEILVTDRAGYSLLFIYKDGEIIYQ